SFAYTNRHGGGRAGGRHFPAGIDRRVFDPRRDLETGVGAANANRNSETATGSSRRSCAQFRGVAARQILRLTLYCALTRMFPGRFYDYLRPAARYAIQNAERAVRELRPSHNSEFDRLQHPANLRPKRPDRGWNRGAN